MDNIRTDLIAKLLEDTPGYRKLISLMEGVEMVIYPSLCNLPTPIKPSPIPVPIPVTKIIGRDVDAETLVIEECDKRFIHLNHENVRVVVESWLNQLQGNSTRMISG